MEKGKSRSNGRYRGDNRSTYDFFTKTWWPFVSKGTWCSIVWTNSLHQHEFVVCIVLQSIIILFSFQGGWEDDETVTEAACREALEEAGVKGIIRVGYDVHHWMFNQFDEFNNHELTMFTLSTNCKSSSPYFIVIDWCTLFHSP